MNQEYKCNSCGILFPIERLFFWCEIDACKKEECDHRTECGFCILLRIPPYADVNMDALLEIL